MITPITSSDIVASTNPPKSKLLLTEVMTFEYDPDDNGGKAEVDPNAPMVLTGILQKANELNQNGRIYPRPILEREVDNYKRLVLSKTAFGELDHCDDFVVNMKNVSHMIEDIWMEGDVVRGKVRIIDTPSGKIIKEIIKAGGKPGISSRALGTVRQEMHAKVVNDDLQIVCWDFVSSPSTHGAYMYLTEGKSFTEEEIRRRLSKPELVRRAADEVLSVLRRR